jgi:hypothetical protein
MLAILVVLLAMSATAGHAQTKSLDFELLTWPELKQASHVVLMGDHGGGQKELAAVATKLAGQGVRVVYYSDIYVKAGTDFDRWLKAHDLPVGSHACIKDTSEAIGKCGGDDGARTRDLRRDRFAVYPLSVNDLPLHSMA